MKKYLGENVWGINVPYVSLVNCPEGLSSDKVNVYFKDKMHELPTRLQEYKDATISKIEAKAKEKGTEFYDGGQVRLNNVGYNSREGKLALMLGKTSFFSLKCSNHAVGEKLDGKLVRETYFDESEIKKMNKDGLANSIGVETGILTSDGKIIIVKRSSKLSQYPGLYGIPAGFMDPTQDKCKVALENKYGRFSLEETVSPFVTSLREMSEEVLGGFREDSIYKSVLEEMSKNMKLIGVGRAYDDLHAEILMTTKTSADSNYIIKSSKFSPDKFEMDEKSKTPVIAVPFNPRDLAMYLTDRIEARPDGTPNIDGIWIPESSPRWVPAHWMTIYAMLINEFGKDEVNQELFNSVSRGEGKKSKKRY